MRQAVQQAERWVIKIGSALLTDDGKGLCTEGLDAWVGQMAALREAGKEVVLVSSGAVAEGMARLGWQQRPTDLHQLQAAAALGQMGLVHAYESRFQTRGLLTAQVLLGHDDVSARDRYLNARGTLLTLLELGVVPVVNENDTVVTDEIRFGDNDSLAALVANLIDADALLILTDQDGMFDADPRTNPSAKLISKVSAADGSLDAMMGGSGALGRGGMQTKLTAARLAARSGAHTVIAGGRNSGIIDAVAAGEEVGTWLLPDQKPLDARKKWLAGLKPTAALCLDEGAVKVLTSSGRSLLPIGVCDLQGEFRRGDMVSCLDPVGRVVAQGLVNYNSDEARKLLRQNSERITEILGYQGEPELIHRDNLVLV